MPRRTDPAELARRLLPLAIGPDPSSSDEELLGRYVRDTDPAAFRALYERYAGLVYRACRRGLGADDAEPAFQAVWLAFARKAHTVRDPGALAGWLLRVAARVVRKARRRAAAAPAIPLGDFVHVVPDRGPAADPGRKAELRDLGDVVVREVAALPDDLRVVFELCYLEGLGRTDAILRLGLSPLQFDRRLRRARDLLRARLAKLGLSLPASLTVAAVAGTAGPPAGLTAVTADAAFAGRAVRWERVALPPAAVTLARAALGIAWHRAVGWAVAVGLLATMAGVAVVPRPDPERDEAAAVPPPPPPVADPPRETLQAKNIRIVRAEVLPVVVAELQKLTGPDNPWTVTDARAFGSEVEVELRPARQVPRVIPARLRLRYCVLRRSMAAAADLDGRWANVNLDRPISLRLPLPFGPDMAVGIGRDTAAAIRGAFERLPPDDRAERDHVLRLFGPGGWDGTEFIVPRGAAAATGNSQTLFVWVTRDGIMNVVTGYVRRATGWRYWGVLPGWTPAVDDTSLYFVREATTVCCLPLDNPAGQPVAVCELPRGDAAYLELAATDGRLFARFVRLKEVWARSLAQPTFGWERLRDPPESDLGFAAGRGWLVSGGTGRAHALRLDPGAEWHQIKDTSRGPYLLTVWQDRLLHLPAEPGPILARPLAAGPAGKWEEVGRVHEPAQR